MKVLFLAAPLLFSFMFLSCKKENRLDCFKGNGPEVTELRRPGDFKDIDLLDKIELVVRKGPECKVEVVAGRNLLKNIGTEINGGMLTIDNRNTCNFVRGYRRGIKVVVTMPYLRYLRNSGVGPARVEEGFSQDTLVVRAESSGDIHIKGTYNEIRTSSHGNGDMYVSGRCNSFFVYTYGTNYVHAEDLRVKEYAFIHQQSLGDCIVNGDSLHVFSCNIEGDGNIRLHGEPQVIVDYSAKGVRGKLIR